MLEQFRVEGRAAFIPFIVAGDPSIEATEKIVDALIEEGADLIELGVPFSDALADGPVIQLASERASKTTPSISIVLDFVSRIQVKHPGFPIILFTYYNPILKMGIREFSERAHKSGVTGVLVVDLPPEEAMFYRECLKKNDVSAIFLASPTSTPDRIKKISEASTGFIYYVSRAGVTGVRDDLSKSLEEEVRRIKNMTSQPVAVGFGISTAAHAKKVAEFADGVVVGSAFVRIMNKYAKTLKLDEMEREVRELARELIAGTRAGRGNNPRKT